MIVLFFVSCSNGSDSAPIIISSPSGGGTQTPTETPTTTPAPTPTLATYTITFNANDGSQNPATATQTFTQGTPQALKTIAELGFSKAGFNFAGWGTAKNATQSSYADGSSYTATANATLYALWSAVPVYNVTVSANEHGTVTATPATATAGTEITLAAAPNRGYKFDSYTITAADGSAVAVTNGKFTMPAQNVKVTTSFDAINYTITCGTYQNGTVTASPATATVGTTVALTAEPDIYYKLTTLTVNDSSGTAVTISGTGNARTFTMPAQDVTVTATFETVAASGVYTVLPKGTNGTAGTSGRYVTFGLWPQTIKSKNVTVNENDFKVVGMFTYYRGSDGEWYAKIKETVYYAFYSNGERVGNGFKYFKVEPIKWRILAVDMVGNGSDFRERETLLAEKILDLCVWSDSAISSGSMTNASVVNPNDYIESRIRAFLNGQKYYRRENWKVVETVDAFEGKGFLQTAFGQEYSGEYFGKFAYNNDSVYLLSKKEYNSFWRESDETRRRESTDYVKATSSTTCWWLQSIDTSTRKDVYIIYGDDGTSGKKEVKNSYGVLPVVWVGSSWVKK